MIKGRRKGFRIERRFKGSKIPHKNQRKPSRTARLNQITPHTIRRKYSAKSYKKYVSFERMQTTTTSGF